MPQSWRAITRSRVRSLPLEGSQQGQQLETAVRPAVRSLPLEGSQLIPVTAATHLVLVRSLPLEGSQPEAREPVAPLGEGSLITPGGIATAVILITSFLSLS